MPPVGVTLLGDANLGLINATEGQRNNKKNVMILMSGKQRNTRNVAGSYKAALRRLQISSWFRHSREDIIHSP